MLLRALVVLLPCLALAQEFRATLSGRISDPSGGAVPGVVVAVRNTGTNEVVNATTGPQGDFTAPFLRPGSYSVTVETSGFKKAVREGVVLNVGQNATLNIALEVGAVTEQITVTAEIPMLETATADRGGVIDNQQVQEFPLNARNPFMLSMLTAGVNYNGNIIYQRPFDNGAIADWSINGSRNRQNEFLLDGAPNNAQAGGNNLALVPSVDAVQEFKIQTNSYDAQYGKTMGGIINVSLKSGSNKFHGTLYEFARRNAWDANSFQNNANGSPKSGHFLDQYGGTASGPIIIPKLYNGTNKSFWMAAYEGYREGTPSPLTLSVPEPEMKEGDFSLLTDAQGRRITIYDYTTGRATSSGQWVRDPFPGNVIPKDRINPIAYKIAKFFPAPNRKVPGVGYSTQNLFVSGGDNVATDDFYNLALKFDHNFGERHKVFFRHASNDRTETRNTNSIKEGPAQDGQHPLKRINDAYVLDWVGTLTSAWITNARLSFNRYIEGSRGDGNVGFDMRTLGFPDSLVSQLPHGPFFGRYEIANYTSLGRYRGFNYTNTWAFHPNATHVRGARTFRFGADARWVQYATQNTGNVLNFQSAAGPTQKEFNRGDALSGNSLATWLLGTPTGGSAVYNVFPIWMSYYVSPWFQHDWKINTRLTVNFGLRWDINTPTVERFNRQNAGFDQETVNPVDAMVDKKAYPFLPTLKGRLLFSGVDGAPVRPAAVDWNNIQPRFGFAWQAVGKLVVRGGWGRYYTNPSNDFNQALGYSISTPYIYTLDGSRTILPNTLNNPFPGGVLIPPGSSQGALSYIGRGFSIFNRDFKVPFVNQFSFGLQYELPFRSRIEASYVGSRGYLLQDSRAVNTYPAELRDQCSYYLGGNPAYCDERLPFNPFYRLPPWEGTGAYSATTSTRPGLARPMPHFGELTMLGLNTGRSWYNSLQTVYEIRGRGGMNLNVSYTFSKHMDQSGWLDTFRAIPNRTLFAADKPHRLVVSNIWQMPFGRGKKFGANASGVASHLISGWEMTTIFQYQSGRPADLPNGIYLKNAVLPEIDWSQPRVRGMSNCNLRWNEDNTITPTPASAAAGCTSYNWLGLPRYTTSSRLIPSRDGRLRLHTVPQLDLSLNKITRINEQLRVQFRAEAFNITNTFYMINQGFDTNLESVNFGTINKAATSYGNANFPRHVQLAVKLIW